MGVQGLSSYLRENRRALSQPLVFSTSSNPLQTPIVVDGWSFIYRLYDESHLPWAFGGEYQEFYELVLKVVRAWTVVGLKPHFVFDGPYTPLKFKTGITRANEGVIHPSVLFFRTSQASRANPRFMRETAILPPLCYATTISALQDLGSAIEIHIADGEADPFAVELAARLGGYVTGQDSDFVVLNVEGYAGYLPLDEISWLAVPHEPDPVLSTASLTSDEGFVVARPKARASRQPPTSDSLVHSLVPPCTDALADISLKCAVYSPLALASHLRLPITLLPLLAALAGNDFTAGRHSHHNLFFERGTTAVQRLSKVATTLLSVLPTPGVARKRTQKPVTSVIDIIELTVDALLVRAPSSLTSGERADIVNDAIEAALQYAIPDRAQEANPELWPTPACAIHVPERCPFVGCMSRPGDMDKDDNTHPFRADVCAAYITAYRRAQLDPRIVDTLHTGTMWPRLSLEDPDLECVARSIGRPLRQWIYAILETGVGLHAARQKKTAEQENKSGSEKSDEDELIDVIEESSEDENSDDPLAPLRGALQDLRVKPNASTPSTISATSSTGLLSRPVFIIEKIRRGTRLVDEEVTVMSFHHMLDALGSDGKDFYPHVTSPPTLWPTSARLSLFLRILGSDTPAVRALSPVDMAPVLSLRWVVNRLHIRAAEPHVSRHREREKWTQREARAFLSAFSNSALGSSGPSAELVPELSNRNVQLVAQVSAAVHTIGLLAQTLLLSEKIPSSAHRFSGRRFHVALTSLPPSSLPTAIWSAAVTGLEHAFATEKIKAKNKQKKAYTQKNEIVHE
ncbi:hypothetical protein K488DRAFT_76193 [Vararia minispora EC-137]|uniref:Uncharacterized protein n=1 Tax=Vararia minispora EC-137 TaxID=1314806 RepID=A0ACB8QX23_9AGAM|nr:hypothetical protein K488DRAFT_76193 [Vararia minispora EC-137]